jgi:hypothetical protein
VRSGGAPPAHRATTAHLQAAYPWVSGGGLDGDGPYIGRSLFGGSFRFDPWSLYAAGVLTSPNLVVLGQIGRGKSTFVKTFVRRQAALGRQAWIVDPKGEYGPLAAAEGAVALRVAPGGALRLNPLDARSAAPELLASIVASSLGHDLGPAQRTAIELAVRAVAHRVSGRVPVLADVVGCLLDPDPALAAEVRTDAAGLAADGRDVALELRRLVEGDLAGMFDGPTSEGIDLGGRLVVLDLSALYSSPALGVLMTCATAWLRAQLLDPDAGQRVVVVDEAWAVLRDLATARWLRATFKLARAYGVVGIAVVHRLSDLRTAGTAGSEERALAEGLLADSETRVVFGQSRSEATDVAAALGLSGTEADLLPQLPRGVALWKVGHRSFLVQHVVDPVDADVVDTDAAMRGRR